MLPFTDGASETPEDSRRLSQPWSGTGSKVEQGSRLGGDEHLPGPCCPVHRGPPGHLGLSAAVHSAGTPW